jgi:hypothetical protein
MIAVRHLSARRRLSAAGRSTLAVASAGVLATLGAIVPAAAPAAAVSPPSLPDGCTQASIGGTVTCTYTDTGAEQTFSVPTGVTSVDLSAVGAHGGATPFSNGAGPGGTASITAYGVTPGNTLYVEVGGNGGNGASASAAGGFNGGGDGGFGSTPGAGGGGASDVRTTARATSGSLNTRVLVAAGGGGGCALATGGGPGGAGGDGANVDTAGGAGATVTAGGAGGSSSDADDGSQGTLGVGGTGGGATGYFSDGGCGGGGGYYGGGGGAGSANSWTGSGGGGSNHASNGTTGTAPAGQAASVTISYAPVGPATALTVSPESKTMAAGTQASYQAVRLNAGGASLADATSNSTFTITDTNGNAVSGASCTNATCTATKAGGYTVTAKDGSLTAASALTVTAGAAARVSKKAGDGQSVLVGKAFPTDLAVVVTDANGNAVGSGTSVTFTVSSGPASFAASTSTATASTDSSGVATTPTLTAGSSTGTVTVTAALTSDPSASVTFTETVYTPTTRYVATTANGGGDGTTANPNDCTDQNSPCATIKHAIGQARAGDTVSIGPGEFDETLLSLEKNLTIIGSAGGSGTLIVGTPNSETLYVDGGVTATLKQLAVSGGGNAVTNHGTVTIADSTITGASLAAVQNSGTVTLADATISDNDKDGVDTYGPAKIIGSTISGNGADGVDADGQLTLTGSTVADNGGIGVDVGRIGQSGNYGYGRVTITASTVTGNEIGMKSDFSQNPVIEIVNSTISANLGDGVLSQGPVAAVGSTIVGNGTVGIKGFSSVNLAATIIAGNKTHDCYGSTATDDGYNIDSDEFCHVSTTVGYDDLRVQSSLSDNGGPTKTLAPASTSPAVDQIPAGTQVTIAGTTYGLCGGTGAHDIVADQRGVARPQPSGGKCDIGVVELAPSTTKLTGSPSSPTPSASVTVTATIASGLSSPSLPAPNGAVSFSLDGSPVGSCHDSPMSGDTASCSVGTLAAGKHKVIASYTGTNGYHASDDRLSVDVSKKAQTITFTPPAAATYGDSDITLHPTSTSKLPVTVTSSTPTVCTVGSHTLHVVGAGSCTLTATQSGNDVYGSARQVTRTVTVAKAVLTVTASSTRISFGHPAPPVLASYSGFVDGDTAATALSKAPSCTTSYTKGRDAGVSYTSSCSGGSAPNYKLSYVDGAVTVTPATQTITFTSTAPATATVGGSYQPAATASSGVDVTFSIDAASDAGVCSISSGTVSFTGAGSCVLDADQPGNTNYQPAVQIRQTIAVAKALQVVTTSLPKATVGTPYSERLSATGGADLHYTWTLTKGSLPPGLTLSRDGVLSGTPTKAGSYTFTISVNDPALATLTLAVAPAAGSQPGSGSQAGGSQPGGSHNGGQPGGGQQGRESGGGHNGGQPSNGQPGQQSGTHHRGHQRGGSDNGHTVNNAAPVTGSESRHGGLAFTGFAVGVAAAAGALLLIVGLLLVAAARLRGRE